MREILAHLLGPHPCALHQFVIDFQLCLSFSNPFLVDQLHNPQSQLGGIDVLAFIRRSLPGLPLRRQRGLHGVDLRAVGFCHKHFPIDCDARVPVATAGNLRSTNNSVYQQSPAFIYLQSLAGGICGEVPILIKIIVFRNPIVVAVDPGPHPVWIAAVVILPPPAVPVLLPLSRIGRYRSQRCQSASCGNGHHRFSIRSHSSSFLWPVFALPGHIPT